MKQLTTRQRIERAVEKHIRHDDWGIAVVSRDEVVKLILAERRRIRREVRKMRDEATVSKFVGSRDAATKEDVMSDDGDCCYPVTGYSKPAMTDHAQRDMTPTEFEARRICNELRLLTCAEREVFMTKALTQAHAQGRLKGMEECADLIEVQELADPSGLTRIEQLWLYSISQKLADMCRAKAKEGV